MSTLQFVGQVDVGVEVDGDGYRARAKAVCIKLDDGYLHRATAFDSDYHTEDERVAIDAAIAGAAQAAMTWCERENTARLLS